MNPIKLLPSSSLGKKYLMAATGCGLFLFVVGHLVGNLQIFLGREAINRYGAFLQSNVELLWPVRIGLLALVALHVWSAIRLTLENREARPVSYAGAPVPTAASYASRTMLVSGLIVAAFIVYHLLHYTACIEAVNLTGKDFTGLKETLRDGTERHDVYRMVVVGFSQPLVCGFYLLGVGLLCLHLSHGIAAMFQSLGWKNEAWRPLIDRAAPLLAWLIFLGYASIPVAVLLGYGKEVVN
jgi:succinate dehydrogenase / fumarate reductase cytochrome b subunit